MASSGNFATLNPLNTRGSSASSMITNGNLQYNGQATQDEAGCTINVGYGGVPKVYFEMYIINNHDTGWIGVYDTHQMTLKYEKAYGTTSYRALLVRTTQKVTGSTTSNYIGDGSDNNSRSGQTIGVAIDVPNQKIWFAVNDAWGSDGASDPSDSNYAFNDLSATGCYDVVTHMGGASVAQPDWCFNFGQDSTFQGRETAGGNADGNGFGDFRYAPPSGFVALCSANISVGTSIDPAETDDNHPQKNFNALIYSGDGTSSNGITGLGFQPDLTWIKERNGTNTYSHSMHDTSRGRARVIFAEDDREEDGSTSTQDLVSFDTDGFTVGTSNESKVNGTGSSFISWNWRCNAGTTATNTSGTITSTVQANQDLGFSIVTWTGTGTSGTVGHGLSSAPDCMWIKNRSDDISSDGDANGRSWTIFHTSLGAGSILSLDETHNAETGTGYLGGTAPTSSVFTVNTSVDSNESSHAMIAYCWHNIEGFQKFGSYKGNGNSDGPFVYTGFRPRLMMLKMSDGSYSEQWNMWDSVDDAKADPCGNPLGEFHRINEGTESTSTSLNVDFLSNGFKIRGSNTEMNESNKNVVYFAWADIPFKYNNSFS